MLHRFKIPASVLCWTIALLAAGEIACGTQPIFVAAMAGTLLCIGMTYNILGGLSTISGIAFASFAACTIVISQFAKVLFMEAADKTLESAELTIKVYFVFYLCVLIGTFATIGLRVRLPRPMEPETPAQANVLYVVALVLGLAANAVYEISETSPDASERASTAHSLGLALSSLLFFSIVLAVQSRIRSTNGMHSFGLKAFVPWIVLMFFGFIETTRTRILLPSIVYAFTCYASGYRFRRRHYAAAILGVAAFVLVISPFEIYARGPMRELTFRDRLYESYNLILSLPDWSVVNEASRSGTESGSREEYYELPGTFVLSRLSVIRADSNMISACAGGFHYGFTALKIDLLRSLPRFLAQSKPDTDGAAYTGRVTGINPDDVENGEFLITAISDSYGAFGWLGVIVVSLMVFPAIFVLYESMFDIGKPWGIVAAGGFTFVFAEADMGKLMALATRTPITIVLLSYAVGLVVKMIPVRGDQGALVDAEPAG